MTIERPSERTKVDLDRAGSSLRTINNRVDFNVFSPPFQWTNEHLRVLRCFFSELEYRAGTGSRASSSAEFAEQSRSGSQGRAPMNPRKAARWARDVATSHAYFARVIAMERLMEYRSFKRLYGRVTIKFDEKIKHKIECTLFSSKDKGPKDDGYCFAALVNYSLVMKSPRERLGRVRSGELTPDDPTRDPAIAGILIALAQRLQQKERLLNISSKYFQVHLIVWSSSGFAKIGVYSANVQRAFLKRIAFTFLPQRDARLDISFTTIPFWPYERLHKRLVGVIHSHRKMLARNG